MKQPFSYPPSQLSISNHLLTPPSQSTLSTHPLNPSCPFTLSIHPINSSSQPILSIHPLNPPYQLTLSTHLLTPPSQSTPSNHHFNPPSQSTPSTRFFIHLLTHPPIPPPLVGDSYSCYVGRSSQYYSISWCRGLQCSLLEDIYHAYPSLLLTPLYSIVPLQCYPTALLLHFTRFELLIVGGPLCITISLILLLCEPLITPYPTPPYLTPSLPYPLLTLPPPYLTPSLPYCLVSLLPCYPTALLPHSPRYLVLIV